MKLGIALGALLELRLETALENDALRWCCGLDFNIT